MKYRYGSEDGERFLNAPQYTSGVVCRTGWGTKAWKVVYADDSTSGPKPTAVVTTRAGTVAHFTDPDRLAGWLEQRPGFPFPDVYEEFLVALEAAGVRRAVNRSATVDEALATVVRINQRR